MDPEAPATPVCYRHPDRPTRISCSDCGKPICPDCTIDAAVGQKCPECAKTDGRARTINVRQTWRPGFGTAPVTMTLLALNVGIYLAGVLSPEFDRWLIENMALINVEVANGEWWRVFTAAFLHAGLFHLAINMYILWLFGTSLERSAGHAPFLALYLASAAAGGAMSALTGPQFSVSVGASGAIFGLFGAWFSASYRSRHTPAGQAMFRQFLILLLLNAAIPLAVPNIDWRAHLGGFIAGVVIHQLWTRLVPGRPDAVAARTAIASGVGLISLSLAMLL
jgi:membrane associated rhomboid family serine protease